MVLRAGSSIVGLVASVLWSASSGSAIAACYTPAQQLPAQTVSDFLGNAGQLLQDPKNANGGADMIALVRDLVASNPGTLPAMIALLANANPAQQTAIGTGLGQAANLCITPDPTFAADIPSQLALSNSDNAKTAYAAATGKPIRSVAGGGGVSGGSSGGSTGGSVGPSGTGTSTFTQFTSNGTVNTPTSFFQAGTTGAGGASSSTNTTTITSAATSVSP